MGIGIAPTTVANGYRTTSASANLKDIPNNLQIWTEATVKRVIVEDTRVVGVEMIDGRKGNDSLHFRTSR
jgi:GMC oxidoreductase